MAAVAKAAALLDLSRPLSRDEFALARADDRTRLWLAEAITTITAERTMASASTLTVNLVDPAWWLIRESDLLGRERLAGGLTTRVDGLDFTLEELEKVDRGEQLVFYESAVAVLRRLDTPRKASRDSMTRAQFAARLCREAGVPFVSPDKNVRQPIEDLPADDRTTLRETRRNRREQGRRRGEVARGALRGKRLKIKGVAANAAQLRKLETAFAEADEQGARDKARLAMVLAMIGESRVGEEVGSRGTTFQTLQLPESRIDLQARHFLRGGKGFRAGGAIAAAREHPEWSAGEVASQTEISDRGGAFYDKYRDEALAILEAWGGKGDPFANRTGTPDRAYVERYEFRVDRGESYWETLKRLAEKVGWRCFVTGGRVYFASDFTLIRQRPSMAIREGENGVDKIRWLVTRARRIDELQVTCRLTRWGAPPGAVVTVEGEGDLVDGAWLVRSVSRSMLDASGTAVITLGQPVAPRPEPASTVVTVQGEEGSGASAGALRDRIVEVAESTLTSKTGYRYYSQAGALTSDPTPPRGKRSDCSQWVRAVYLKAGAKDPGLNTWEQARRGRRTKNPKPGDLMFPPGVGHVELYVGAGRTIGHGSPPIDYATPGAWPGHFFVTFDFLNDD